MCNFIVHEKCIPSVVTPCSSIAPCIIKNPVAHCWSEPTHHKRKFCTVCRKRFDESPAVHCMSKYHSDLPCLFYKQLKMCISIKCFHLFFLSCSMRIFCTCRLPRFCYTRLQRECHLCSRQRAIVGETPSKHSFLKLKTYSILRSKIES